MATAEAAAASTKAPAEQRRASERRWAWPALALILALGAGLRVWGVRQGLPFAYNTDEADHFVTHAVRMSRDGTLNPHYFANPPGFTYLLHALFAIAYGGGRSVVRAFALHPADVYALARLAAAALGTISLWLLYATGARLFGRAAGLLAAAVEAVAFLPVFYSHLALNDVPTLAPLTLSLLGSAGILRRGAVRDHLLAGAGLGLACATKYTAGIALLPLAAAVIVRLRRPGAEVPRELAAALAAGAVALAAFLLANPFSLLDLHSFRGELARQSSLSSEAQGKLGAPHGGGFAYYLWSLTWGLGWAPALAALGGAVAIWRRDAAAGWLLVPAPLAFLVFMGLQGRYFGRWMLPIFPLLCLLAAYLVVAGARRALRPRPHPAARLGRRALVAAVVVALLAQGVVHSVHSGLVLSRADTRNLTRLWMTAHVPSGAHIVVEPVSPDEWAHQSAPGTSTAANPPRWHKYSSMLSRISASGGLLARTVQVGIENYERTLAPALIGYYEAHGYCWVVSGSTQSGRARADPAAAGQAIAYYRALEAQATVVFRASPYVRGSRPPSFNFDWSFDYYPLAYERPGPAMTVYRLHGGRCRS